MKSDKDAAEHETAEDEFLKAWLCTKFNKVLNAHRGGIVTLKTFFDDAPELAPYLLVIEEYMDTAIKHGQEKLKLLGCTELEIEGHTVVLKQWQVE